MDNNPYQSPQVLQTSKDDTRRLHRSFRLTVSDDDPNFKVGTLYQAIVFTWVQQVPILVLTGMLLDGGKLSQIAMFASMAYWCGFAIIALSRRFKFSDADVLLTKWGYWPILLIVYNAKLIISVAMR